MESLNGHDDGKYEMGVKSDLNVLKLVSWTCIVPVLRQT